MKKVNKLNKKKTEQIYSVNTRLLAFDGYYNEYNIFKDKNRYFIVIELNGDANTVNDGIMDIISDLNEDVTVQILICNYELEISDTIQVPIIPNDSLTTLRNSFSDKIKEYNQNLNSVSHNTYIIISMKGFIDDVKEQFSKI